jgi:hypothetical protein
MGTKLWACELPFHLVESVYINKKLLASRLSPLSDTHSDVNFEKPEFPNHTAIYI